MGTIKTQNSPRSIPGGDKVEEDAFLQFDNINDNSVEDMLGGSTKNRVMGLGMFTPGNFTRTNNLL